MTVLEKQKFRGGLLCDVMKQIDEKIGGSKLRTQSAHVNATGAIDPDTLAAELAAAGCPLNIRQKAELEKLTNADTPERAVSMLAQAGRITPSRPIFLAQDVKDAVYEPRNGGCFGGYVARVERK